MQRILSLFDTHIPFNIPLDPVFEFAKDFKPTIVVLGGDIHEWGAVSTWVSDQSRHFDSGTITMAYEQMHTTVLQPIELVAPKAKKIFLTGNHEDWIRKACDANPNLRGYAELERNISGWKIIPVNAPYRVGENLVYIHGTYTNEYHAKKTAVAYHRSVIYGHMHEVQSHTLVSPIDDSIFYKAQSVGCLCHLNPEWKKNKPNSWVNGFNFCYMNEDGTFQDFNVVIVKGKFWAEGRQYK